MRQTRKPQLALGEARIEDIKLDHKYRDDIPAVLLGLQHLYSHEETREKLFSLLEEHILRAPIATWEVRGWSCGGSW